VLDWGLAKALEQDGADSVAVPATEGPDDPMQSRAGAIVGTPAYMSPEQARGDAGAVGTRADVFTLGANLFHLATGRPPGYRDDLRALIKSRRIEDAPRLRDVRADAPAELDAICSRAMAFRPEDRYPTAAELAADIRAFLARRAEVGSI
jgi:eukaryotic-like serine/threonine-protein kinase